MHPNTTLNNTLNLFKDGVMSTCKKIPLYAKGNGISLKSHFKS